jgi:hypothetical protein
MVTRNPYPGRMSLGSFGLGGPVPKDVLLLLGVLLATFSLRFFDTTAVYPALLQLTPFSWQLGYVWQVVTYPFVGWGSPGIGFLLELLMIYIFGKDVFYGLYRRHFWRLILWSSAGAAVVAVALHAGLWLAGIRFETPFLLMQGQRVLLALLIAAFATARSDAVIYLFFVLPIKARWFIGIEILIAFMGFLATRDLPGFLGFCTAVGLSVAYVRASGSWTGGRRRWRELRLRLERWWIQKKLDRARRKRGLRVINGEKGTNVRRGPWVH